MKKTLIILRHAKAESASADGDDHERPLADRGIEAAGTMGERMAALRLRPDKVLCSTSQRTCQTWDLIAPFFADDTPVEYARKLYLASAKELLKIIAGTHDEVNTLMLVGHNPGLHELVIKLAKSGEEKLLHDATLNFPTCALAVITFERAEWDALAGGRIGCFVTP